MSDYYDSPRQLFFGIWGWIFASVVMILILVSLLFAFGVGTADIFGKGNAYKQQRSGTNRIFAQQQFYDLYTDYQATLAKIPLYQEAAKNGDTAANTNLSGVVSHCLDVVGQYNAASGKYLTKDFKDANLPVTLESMTCRPS